MKKLIERLVETGWENKDFPPIEYKEYWKAIPHCDEAVPVKDIFGKILHRCIHRRGDDD